MMNIPLQCLACRHYQKRTLQCSAFPDQIPDEILDMDFDHRHPYPGDQGVHWEPREPGVKHPFDEDSKRG